MSNDKNVYTPLFNDVTDKGGLLAALGSTYQADNLQKIASIQ